MTPQSAPDLVGSAGQAPWQPVDEAGRQLIGDDIPSERFALRCESVGIRRVCLPIRALSAGRLAGLGARPAFSTDCYGARSYFVRPPPANGREAGPSATKT